MSIPLNRRELWSDQRNSSLLPLWTLTCYIWLAAYDGHWTLPAVVNIPEAEATIPAAAVLG